MRLRSLLFVPGDRPDRIAKAAASGADALILDLEDAVSPEAKPAARAAVRAALVGDRSGPALFVRINPLGTALAEQDLDALAGTRPDGIVLPKAEGAGSVRLLANGLAGSGLMILRPPNVWQSSSRPGPCGSTRRTSSDPISRSVATSSPAWASRTLRRAWPFHE